MNSLAKTYGKGLTAVFLLLTAIWAILLITLPQGFMLDQSMWSKLTGSQITEQIDKAYRLLSVLQYDLASLEADAAALIKEQIAALELDIEGLLAQEVAPVKVYSFQNYTMMSELHFSIFLKTIGYSLAVTVLALVVCYPIAFIIAQVATPHRAALMMLGLIIPYAINELLRVYAWLMILDYNGVFNNLLDWLGFIDLESGGAIPFLQYSGSVFVALIYAYVLVMIFPIYNTIDTLDRNQIEAARDLGANSLRIHWRVVIPHAKPGIAVGCIMTFMLSVGSYAVPMIMSRGTAGSWFTQLIYSQFFDAFNWNLGAAYAFSLLLVCIAFVLIMMRVFRVSIADIAK